MEASGAIFIQSACYIDAQRLVSFPNSPPTTCIHQSVNSLPSKAPPHLFVQLQLQCQLPSPLYEQLRLLA